MAPAEILGNFVYQLINGILLAKDITRQNSERPSVYSRGISLSVVGKYFGKIFIVHNYHRLVCEIALPES